MRIALMHDDDQVARTFLEEHFMCIVGPVLEEKVKLCFSNETWKYFIKKNFKTRFYSIIYLFKNYFIIVFLVFSKISSIQIHQKLLNLGKNILS